MAEQPNPSAESRQTAEDPAAQAEHRVAGPSEIGRILGVPPNQIWTWASRRERNGFPRPLVEKVRLGRLGRPGALYDLGEVLEWHEHYVPDKGGNPNFKKQQKEDEDMDDIPVDTTRKHRHDWPKNDEDHLWGPWYTDKGGKGVASQYRVCVHPCCDAVDRRSYPH